MPTGKRGYTVHRIRKGEHRPEHDNNYHEALRKKLYPNGIEKVIPPWLLFGRLSIAAYYGQKDGREEKIAQAYSIPTL